MATDKAAPIAGSVTDSISLPHYAMHVRRYSDGSVYAESADQSVRIRIHPWVQGQMGRLEK